MLNVLQNKVILLTGAGTGIGRACALAFAREGASLALIGRRREKLEAVAKECGTAPLVISADLARKAEIIRAGLDLGPGPGDDRRPADFDHQG